MGVMGYDAMLRLARKRDIAALEARRFEAARLFARGASQATTIVERFGGQSPDGASLVPHLGGGWPLLSRGTATIL
jgi:hypothetical protein